MQSNNEIEPTVNPDPQHVQRHYSNSYITSQPPTAYTSHAFPSLPHLTHTWQDPKSLYDASIVGASAKALYQTAAQSTSPELPSHQHQWKNLISTPHGLPTPTELPSIHHSHIPSTNQTIGSLPNSVKDFLIRLDLSEYYPIFVNEGFDRISSILEITEDDLAALNVKRGHRRVIQREVANIKGISPLTPLNVASGLTAGATSETNDSGNESRTVSQLNRNTIVFQKQPKGPHAGSSSGVMISDKVEGEEGMMGDGNSKRRYRRHPKPDPNAPEKPPSAYVGFSNQIREELKGSKSFTEIARIVGDRWKTLEPIAKEVIEAKANQAKEEYNQIMAEYKKTPMYAEYQAYLVDFRQRHPKSTVSPAIETNTLKRKESNLTGGALSSSEESTINSFRPSPGQLPTPTELPKTRSKKLRRTSLEQQPIISPQLLPSVTSPTFTPPPNRNTVDYSPWSTSTTFPTVTASLPTHYTMNHPFSGARTTYGPSTADPSGSLVSSLSRGDLTGSSTQPSPPLRSPLLSMPPPIVTGTNIDPIAPLYRTRSNSGRSVDARAP